MIAYHRRTATPWAVAAALFLLMGPLSSVRADVFGRLTITVKDSDTGKPIPNADVTLHDTAGVHGDTDLVTDKTGTVTSDLLEIRAWQITTEADGYTTDTRTVTVAADSTTPVEVNLVTAEKVIKINATKTLVNTSKTSDSTVHTQQQISHTPSGTDNPQSLNSLLVTNPGMVESTNNQTHPRGEHASTTIYLDGNQLPNATIGRGGQFLSPETIQSADIMTGAYAPEYGGEAAAILNLNLRQGTITPFTDLGLQAGGFDTWDGDITVGGQSGAPLEPGVDNGPKKLDYFLSLNNRFTDNALEPPQPDDQDAHNAGVSSTMLGNFDYIPDPKDQFSLVLDTTPATTEVANRTGLSSYYAPAGQGFGYGGARDANGYLPGWGPGDGNVPGAPLGAFVPGLGSQEQDGQDIYQYDNNTFGVMSFRHTFDPKTTGLVSFSQTQSVTQLRNNNPTNNILDSLNPDGTLTTTDNSIEFNPDMTRLYNQSEVQGSVTKSQGTHTLKVGAVLDDQTGDESYQFTPQSQMAVDALANIYAFAPGITLANNPFIPKGMTATGATDALGNPVVTLPAAGAVFPVVTVHKDGYYGAAYLQDTWDESKRFTVNYGARYDMYHQSQDTSNTDGYSNASTLTQVTLSPRLNTAYVLARGTVARLSYDHLFTEPPLAQGAIVGFSIKPETYDQYEGSVEKQLSATQSTKIDYYYKNIRNQDDTGILIPFTQIGALTTLNYQYASVHGLEFSYDVNPRNNVGVGGFVAYTYSVAKPGGLNEVGTQAPYINDHNQYNTLTTGMDYTWKSQAYVSGTVYAGTGEASSALVPVAVANGGSLGPENEPSLQDGHTIPRAQVDVRLASSPMMLGVAGMQLDVINLFDSLAVDNYNSGFSGTRFQQARTVMVSMNAKF